MPIDRKRKQQWLSQNYKPVPTQKPVSKSLLCLWWNMKAVVHDEQLENERTFFCQRLDRVNETLR